MNTQEPVPEDICVAIEKLYELGETEVPDVGDVQILEDAKIEPPLRIGNKTIQDWEVTEGNPSHGELRSDDHISLWVVENRVFEDCPNCGYNTRTFEYKTHHNIAGGIKFYCPKCHHSYQEDSW